jgi:hypothetical protein
LGDAACGAVAWFVIACDMACVEAANAIQQEKNAE